MPRTLAEALGVDPNDADFIAAGEDAHAYEDLVDALVSARKSSGLSQQQVASAMGTTQSAVSDFERLGGDARVSTVQRYARAVGATMTLVVTETSSATSGREISASPGSSHRQRQPKTRVDRRAIATGVGLLALSGLLLTSCAVFDPQRQLTIEFLMVDRAQSDDPQAVDVTTNPKNITDTTCGDRLPCVEAYSTAEANYLRFESKVAAAEYAATLDDGFVRNYIVMDFAGKDEASRDQQLWAMQNLAGTWEDYEGSFPDR